VERSSSKCQREETSSIGEELNQMYLQWNFISIKKEQEVLITSHNMHVEKEQQQAPKRSTQFLKKLTLYQASTEQKPKKKSFYKFH
jgi:hypothetical protein